LALQGRRVEWWRVNNVALAKEQLPEICEGFARDGLRISEPIVAGRVQVRVGDALAVQRPRLTNLILMTFRPVFVHR
jgi:hypothetical protein